MTIAVLNKSKIAEEAGTITVYNYSANTGEFMGESTEYLAIGIGLPAYSTEISPVAARDGFIPVFENSKWIQQENHRGETVYSTDSRDPSVIDYLGAIRDGFTTLSPGTPFDKWDGSSWVVDQTAQHAAGVVQATQQKNTLRAAADSEITWRQDAVDADIATEQEVSELAAWKKYRVLLMRVDTAAPAWPTAPEA